MNIYFVTIINKQAVINKSLTLNPAKLVYIQNNTHQSKPNPFIKIFFLYNLKLRKTQIGIKSNTRKLNLNTHYENYKYFGGND